MNFIIERLKSLTFVAKGILRLVSTENAAKVHVMIFILFTILGIYTKISKWEWALQFMAFGHIFTAEAFNTSIEKICDFIHPERHEKIGHIKDIAAAGVGFAGISGLIVAILIYAKYLC